MIRLAEKPMRQRLFDDRVGYFTLNQGDFGTNQHKLVSRAYIARWRLEKKDPAAAISEPIKPIVFYVDPATPKKWVPYIKKAVENWQPAFEEAGFKNAIIAKEAPSPEEDPDWSIEDVRYSVIHWVPAGIENAFGPHISDRRSGEILNAPVAVYHNIMNLQRAWYFLQVGALDPRAQKFPLPDDLMGKLIEYVVTHEVGHSLGLRHNFKASSLYTLEQIRNPEWVKKMGHTPSIMDYARFNYVAQPEDKIDVDDLTPKIGPYDKWAIKWGYAPLPQVQTADEEKPLLDQWAQEQEAKPWLRFADDKAAQGADPGEETEAVGDADAVAATALGVKNLERVSKLLFSATTTEKGAPYSDLREMYGRMVRQWTMEMNHVARIPGGATTTNRHVGQEGLVYTPWSRDRQVAAVKFLSENAFQTPKFFLDRNVLRRIEPSGFIVTINKAQSTILKNLLVTDKLTRMEEWLDTDGPNAYSPVDFLADVRKGVFKELEGTGPIKIDAMRRSLQQSYVDTMANNLGGVQRPYYRGELVALNNKIKASTARAGDSVTREHLDDIKDQIAKALDPKFAPPAPPTRHRMAFSDSETMLDFTECWPE
jgi:hypothetical protein